MATVPARVKPPVVVGPQDHGRRMSLKDFDHAEVVPGYLYELGRGIIIVSDVPGMRHLAQVHETRRQLYVYSAAHPDRIHTIAAGSDCKLLLPQVESERHPDITVYKKPPPRSNRDLWVTWIPALVIEVVSRSSERRDYEDKREEYLLFGAAEYWILDADRREMLVLRRVRGDWTERVVRPPAVYRTRVLPGLAFSCAAVFDAADAAGR
jgi:Uma2 family endonuclease